MKSILILISVIACSKMQDCFAQKANNVSLLGVFDGRTPCLQLAKQLDEKTSADCMKIKWRLILYKDSITGAPAGYELTGFVYKRGDPRKGNWHIIKEKRGNNNVTIYQLDQAGRKPLFLLKADDNILFFLDENKKILVGNRDFSYTLNRKP